MINEHVLKTSGADVLPSGKKKKSQKKAQGEGGNWVATTTPKSLLRPRIKMHLNLPQQ